MYLDGYKSLKTPYTVLYNPITNVTLNYINGKWWFIERLSYDIDGFYRYYPVYIYKPTKEDEESQAWIMISKYAS